MSVLEKVYRMFCPLSSPLKEMDKMAKMKKMIFKEKYVQVPNSTAKAPESRTNSKAISLQSLGLIVNLWSYDLDEWELHKTELYERFVKNKETSVRNAWNELIEANYIFEFKYREGKKWEYVYYYNIEPFTDENIDFMQSEARKEYGEIWGLDFQESKKMFSFEDLIFQTSKCRPQEPEISNTNKQNTNKHNTNIKNLVNKESMIDTANSFYRTMATGRWSKKQWFTIIDKLTDEIIESGFKFQNPNHMKAYIRGCLYNICGHYDWKNGRRKIEEVHEPDKVPFYNWLEQF